MMRKVVISSFSFVLFVLFVVPSSAAAPTYWQDIRPVLRKHCTVCHNEKRVGEVDISGGLALDSYEAVAKRPKRAVIQAGKSAESKLVKLLLVNDENKRMPQGAPALPDETIALIRRWIDSGAKEGTKPASVQTIDAKTETVRTRKLDVVLPTNVIPPAGFFGTDKPAKLDLALKIGPLSPIAAVAFSPDGKLLAVGSYGLVTIWDLEKGQPAKTLTSVLGAVNCLRFSPDGQTLAVAGGQPSAKGEVRLFKVADWSLVAALPGHTDVVSCIAFTADGKQLATASFDKTVRVWDLATYKVTKTLTGHSDFVYSVAFSPDGQWLVSASKDRTIKMVETATGKSLLTFSGMDQDVLTVAVSPDGRQIVSSGLESQLFWWNPKTGERVRRQNGHGVAVHEVCFSKDGKRVASAGADRTVRLWTGDTGNVQQTINVGSIVYAVALTPDGQRVAAAGADGLVRLYDASGRHLLTLLSLLPSGEQHDWLAIVPEGYASGSDSLVALGQWRMAGKGVDAEPVWKTLRRAEAVAKANRGETLAAPMFPK
jgi:WD40 repeat protein